MATPATSSRNRALSAEELDRFGAELDALRARTLATLGARDARYIRNVVKAVRYSNLIGRALLFAAAIAGGLHRARRPGRILAKTGAGPDHPVAADYPEGEYLKCIFCRVL